MIYKNFSVLPLLVSLSLQAEELERLTITSCAYQAGTASEIQTIRQTEGDDWNEFEKKIMSIYKEGQGRSDLLAIARRVYLQPIKRTPHEVHVDMFNACVKRVNGTEPAA